MRVIALVCITCSLVFFIIGPSCPAFGAAIDDDQDGSQSGTVYVMTNAAAANSIVVLHRNDDGSLVRLDEIPTGGQGSGPGALPPRFGGGPGPNPLTSSYSLVLSPDHRFLIAANPGSSDLSVLAIEGNGLRLVDRVPSGGDFPVSIAVHKKLVYVLNQRGTPNISGFVLDHEGRLLPIPDSTQQAGSSGASASAIGFDPGGRFLIVTETLGNLIHVFRMGDDGRPQVHLTYPSAGRTPSALAFTHHDILAVTEANELEQQTGTPNGASMSTYHLTEDGVLEPISQAVPDNSTATCWVRFTANGHFAFVSSMGSGAISSYAVSSRGELALQARVAADTGGLRSVPLDIAITPDSKFLYVLTGLAQSVKGFQVNDDGSLTPVTSVNGFPISVQGIVAR